MAQPTPPKRRKTSTRVRFADRASSIVITAGGLVVIVAVLGIAVYLLSVVGALFTPGSVETRSRYTTPAALDEPTVLLEVDEFGSSAMHLTRDGALRVLDLDTGALVNERSVVDPPAPVVAHSRTVRGGHLALGLRDGSVILGEAVFETEFLAGEAPEPLRDLAVGERRHWEGGVIERTPIGQLRMVRPVVSFAQPVRLRAGAGAIRHLDYYASDRNEYLLALREDGSLLLNLVTRIQSLMGGPPRTRVSSYQLPFEPPTGKTLDDVEAVFITGDGASALVLYSDGLCLRFATDDPENAQLAETVPLLDEGRTVTATGKMLGERTIVIGDDAGAILGCFVARSELAPTPDRKRLVRAHVFAPPLASGLSAEVASVRASTRGRTFIAADRAGALAIRNMTSHARVAQAAHPSGRPVVDIALFPKVDGFLAMDDAGELALWRLDPAHPEASFASLFGKVWYEGEPQPAYTYQSSSGDDAAEAKFSLVPLLFGAIKATIYTMLLAVPLGIMAAIYTSEFLTPRLRTAVKPALEMMASLPSVVLGFIAAMLLAPLVRDWLPGALLAFAAIPIGVLFGAYLWHFLPTRAAARASAGGRLALIAAVTILAGFLALRAGSTLEALLFQPSDADVLARAGSYETVERSQWPDWLERAGVVDDSARRRLRSQGLYFRDGVVVRPAGDVDDPDLAQTIRLNGFDQPSIRAWLDGVIGGPWPGWFLLSFPLAAVAISIIVGRIVDPVVRDLDRALSAPAEALVELSKFLAALALTVAAAAALATLLTTMGLDARDSIFGAYQQRNTLVVAIAMAVAVIPIIYTIADDAMTSVPQSVRSASLGAGATRWQTAIRVVLPIAMSGVFSACMIGLGRAAGETMIVLMATGNTPIMSWSLFDGLRTLSANIAVELPEAPKDSVHYRVLFLCGLALFAITFCINTLAELVRQRVRKRSAML